AGAAGAVPHRDAAGAERRRGGPGGAAGAGAGASAAARAPRLPVFGRATVGAARRGGVGGRAAAPVPVIDPGRVLARGRRGRHNGAVVTNRRFAMSSPLRADRELLVGVRALQQGAISQDDLLAALRDWVEDTSRPLAEVLVRQQRLTPQRRRD